MQKALNKAPPMDVMRSIVLTSIACKGVKYFALFQKHSVYSVVSIAGGDDPKKQKHKTSADHEGGENPEWDQAMMFDLEHGEFQDLFLEFRIMAQGNLLGDKLIGKSRASIADLAEGNPTGFVRHVSYQVRSSDGKPNGVLRFSYKLNLPEMLLPVTLDPMTPSMPLKDSFLLLPARAPKESLYPPLPLPEDSHVDYFFNCNQRSPPDSASYYTPPPPLPQHSAGYCPPSDRAVYIPVSTRQAEYLSGSVSSNREYYPPQRMELPPPMPASGTYYTPTELPPPMPASGTYYTPTVLRPTMPAFGTYYTPTASGYDCPSYPQDACCYCNGKCN